MPDPEPRSTLTEAKPSLAAPWGWLPLRYSLPLLLLIFGAVLIGFELIVFSTVDARRAREATIARCKRTGERVARIIGRSMERKELDVIRGELQLIHQEPDVRLTQIFDTHGQPDSRFHNLVREGADAVALQRVAARLFQSKDSDSVVEAEPGSSSVVGVFSLTSEMSQTVDGAFGLELDLAKPLKDAKGTAVTNAVASGTMLLVACGLLWWVLTRVITRRVTRIMEDARAIATEQAPGQPMGGHDELAEIDRALHGTHAIIAAQAESLRAQERRYRTMVESLPAMVFIVRDNGIEYMNPTGLQMLGLKHMDEIVGKSALTFIDEKYHDIVRARSAKLTAEGGTAPTLEEEIIRTDGTRVAIETVGSLFTDARGKAIQVVMHDISERKHAEARREALGREITDTSEREQRRIGQDLHDDICQRLAAVKMSMQDLEESLAEQAPSLMSEADAIVDRLTDAIQITRSLARGLSPVEIEAGGLGMALAALARNTREVLGVDCDLEVPEELPALSPRLATQFYRIAQEAITNAAKHAHASLVRVVLMVDDGKLIMRVSNDGQPFLTTTPASQGMGLHIMRHRAQSIDATLHFEPKPSDAAFAVRCELPLTAIPPDTSH